MNGTTEIHMPRPRPWWRHAARDAALLVCIVALAALWLMTGEL